MGKGLVFIIAGYSFEKIKNIKIILEENRRSLWPGVRDFLAKRMKSKQQQ